MRTAWRARMCPVLYYAVTLTGALIAEAREPLASSGGPLILHARIRESRTVSNNRAPKGPERKRKSSVGTLSRRRSSSATCGTSTGAAERPAGWASSPLR